MRAKTQPLRPFDCVEKATKTGFSDAKRENVLSPKDKAKLYAEHLIFDESDEIPRSKSPKSKSKRGQSDATKVRASQQKCSNEETTDVSDNASGTEPRSLCGPATAKTSKNQAEKKHEHVDVSNTAVRSMNVTKEKAKQRARLLLEGTADEERVQTQDRKRSSSTSRSRSKKSSSSPDLARLIIDIQAPSITSPAAQLKSPAKLSLEMSKDLSKVSLEDLEVITTIGAGSFGVVKLVAHRKHSNYTMALKVLSKAFICKMRQKKQVLREASLYKTIDHPGIAKLHATFQDEGHLYMLMQFCGGGELFTMLYEESSPVSPRGAGMREDAVRFYMANVLLALAHLHYHDIVYRDLKMENLVLDAAGYPKMVDLGFAKSLHHDARTYTKCGSPHYMAPELHLSKGHGKPVDIWAYGVILFEMLTGSTPFSDSNPQQIARKVVRIEIDWPKGFRKQHQVISNLIEKLLVRNPDKRFGVKQALRAVRDTSQSGSVGTSRIHSPSNFLRRRSSCSPAIDTTLLSCSGGLNPAEGMKAHKFFASVNWEALLRQEETAPVVPHLDDSRDCSMFQEFSSSDDDKVPYEDDGADWSEGF